MEQASSNAGSIPITVNANIINELSSKIPTSFVALNEQIKNAYDANAEKVDISFDENKRYLSIQDNGEGMDTEDVQGLFNIAKQKNYETIITHEDKSGIKRPRYIQGAKGLGFLAALKFGKKVTWTSRKHNREIQFKISNKAKLRARMWISST